MSSAQDTIADTVARLQRGIEAFNRRDLDGALEPLDPDVELVTMRAVLEGGSYHGHEGLRRVLKDMSEDWERFQLEADEFRTVGSDRVLVLGTVHATGRASGVEGRYEAAWLCYLRAGLVVRVQFYADRDHAIAEAG